MEEVLFWEIFQWPKGRRRQWLFAMESYAQIQKINQNLWMRKNSEKVELSCSTLPQRPKKYAEHQIVLFRGYLSSLNWSEKCSWSVSSRWLRSWSFSLDSKTSTRRTLRHTESSSTSNGGLSSNNNREFSSGPVIMDVDTVPENTTERFQEVFNNISRKIRRLKK